MIMCVGSVAIKELCVTQIVIADACVGTKIMDERKSDP